MKVRSKIDGFDLTKNKEYDVLFEYATVYEIVCDDGGSYCRNKDFFDIVEDVEILFKSSVLSINKEVNGWNLSIKSVNDYEKGFAKYYNRALEEMFVPRIEASLPDDYFKLKKKVIELLKLGKINIVTVLNQLSMMLKKDRGYVYFRKFLDVNDKDYIHMTDVLVMLAVFNAVLEVLKDMGIFKADEYLREVIDFQTDEKMLPFLHAYLLKNTLDLPELIADINSVFFKYVIKLIDSKKITYDFYMIPKELEAETNIF